MADIMLSKAVRSNLLSLQSTANMMAKTQERLSTGLKVNSALDDPSAFFTSSSLQSRAGDLSRILDSVSNAVQTIRAADEGITAITKLVESAQATARQALQSSKPSNAKVEGTGGTISSDQKASVTGTGLANQNNLLASLETATDTKAATTSGSAAVTTPANLATDITGFVPNHTSTLTFADAADIDGGAATDQAANGETLSIAIAGLDGGNGVGASVDFTIGEGALNTSSGLKTAIEAAFGTSITVSTNGNDLVIESDTAVTVGGATTNGGGFLDGQAATTVDAGANQAFSLTIGGNTNSYELGMNSSLDDLVSAINNDATNGLKDKVVAENDNGTLKLTAKDDSTTFTIGGDANVLSALNLTAGAVAPDTAGENNELSITVGGAAATFRVGTSTGEVNTLTDLVNAINNNDDISGLVKASNENGQLKLEAKFADDDITLGGTADVTKFGLQAGPSNSVRNLLAQNAVTGGDKVTAVSKEVGPGATALSGLGGFANGDSLAVTVNGTTSTLTFNAADGTGTNGQFNTLDGLVAELNNLGLSATVEDDRLSITSTASGSFSIEVGTAASATASVDSLLGIKDGFNYSKDTTTGGYSTSTTDSTAGYSYTSGSGEQTLSIQVGSRPATEIKFGHGAGRVSTFEELQEALSNLVGGSASIDASGNISVEADEYGDDVSISGTADLKKFGLSAGTYEEKTSTTRTQLQEEFNSLRQQIDQLSKDSSFNGVNLLNGDSLTVTFNEDGSSKLDISGVTFNSKELGVSEVGGDGFQSNSSINDALKELDSALTSLRTQASVFGSKLSTVEIRQDFTKGLSNVLETGAANLTLADTNEEGANMLALQTRQSLSSTALSLASQADQNVMRLF